jgi:tetratricopeptide (TPR) repeat protein
MNKCPFLCVHKITKEIRYDSEGKVSEEKETPSAELRDCLEAQCEIFDSTAGKCSLPMIDSKISQPGRISSQEELLATLKAILSETKDARENSAASQIHVLKKAETTNEILNGLREKLGASQAVDLSPLQNSLSEVKASLDQNQIKFTDILELMLEEQQKRSAEGMALKDTLSPVLQSISEVKASLDQNQTKFSDILELILEDQQKRASQGERETELLSEISQKNDKLVEALARGLNADSINDALSKMVDRSSEYMKSLSDSDAARQARLEQVEQQLIKLQQTIQELLEGQRNEQRDVSNERRRQRANEYNDRGVMLFHRRELAAAEAEFRKALDIRPDFAEAYNNLGLTLSDLGKKEESVEAFKRAIDLAPDAPEAYNNLGCLFRIKKEYQQAVELFNQAIAKREDYSLAYFNLGIAYEELEKFDLAIKAWEKVLNLQPTHEEARRKLASYRARR